MNKSQNRKPTYNLVNAEHLFCEIVKNPIYKDSNHFSKSIIKFKSKFIIDNIDEFERKIDEIIIKDIVNSDKTKDSNNRAQNTKMDELQSDESEIELTLAEKEIIKLRTANIKKRNQGSFKKQMVDIKSLESINSRTGQYTKGVQAIEGYNIFNDLNYGDFVLVFHNPMYDFCFEQLEINIKKLDLIDKRKNSQVKSGGGKSSQNITRDRLKQEKDRKASINRCEKARENVMRSLGFFCDGDYFEMREDIQKLTGEDGRIISSNEFNIPGGQKYGKRETQKNYIITVREAFQIYDETINIVSNIFNLNKDYMIDEETAFKNAVVFHAKKFYQISYDTLDSNNQTKHNDYFSTDFSQKPFSNYVFPLFDYFFTNKENPLTILKRYHFSFLYEINNQYLKNVWDLVIDKRFLNKLLRNIMILKINTIGIHTRQFYSEDMRRIFLVMRCQDNVLRTRAEVLFSLQINILISIQ